MRHPPLTLRLRTRGHGIPTLSLWLPLFLIWPVLALLFLLVSPLLLIGALVLSLGFQATWDWPALIAEFYALLCGLRGLEVDFDEGRKNFSVYVRFD